MLRNYRIKKCKIRVESTSDNRTRFQVFDSLTGRILLYWYDILSDKELNDKEFLTDYIINSVNVEYPNFL